MSDLARLRRRFAEDTCGRAGVRTAALAEALASVPREVFLPPGPWTVMGVGDAFGGRLTQDADPRHLYQDVSVAIDPSRQLYNGSPSSVLPALDALGLQAGSRVLHLGCGLGYYTALMATVAGASGRVRAVEVDGQLAAQARRNLASFGEVEVAHGDGRAVPDGPLDAILVHAGVTHPLDTWMDALVPGGRLVLPITATMPQLGPLGKGLMIVLTRRDDGTFDCRVLGFVMIYSALGIRDDSLNAVIGATLMKGPPPPSARLRRDRHEPCQTCWLHTPVSCLDALRGRNP